MPGNIVLVGFSCTGKSAVARLVAERLGWEAVDTDHWIERWAGKAIHAIFREEGEERFRTLERQAVREACAGEHRVVATGGGAVVAEENRAAMFAGNLVVCLDARPETIVARLREAARDEPRPLLSGGDPLGRVRDLKASRQHLYRLAHAVVATDDLSPEQVAERVLQAFREWNGHG